MERFSSRESVLLGYRNSPSRSSSSSFSDALVDFQDVFGGPPRRVSVQDGRYSFNSDIVEDEAVVGRVEARRNPWGGLGIGEKPVFGEATSRRNTSDDFFDDIFRGDSTPGSTIKRDLYASSVPADAAFMSRDDAFGGAPQSSVPAKMNKGMEIPVFASVSRSPRRSRDNYPPSPTLPSSRLARHGSQNQSDSTNEAQLLYRQSPRSVEFSFTDDGSIKVTKSDKGNREDIMKQSSTVSDSLINSNQFHFSIYKWASKGAPPMIPFRGGVNFRLRDKSTSKSLNDEEKFAVDVETEQVAANLEGEGIASSRNFELKESKTSRSNMTEKVDEQISKMKSEAVLDRGLNPSVEENEVTGHVPDPLENSANIVKDISDDFSYHEIRARGKSRTVTDLESNDIKEDETIEIDKENKKFDPATTIDENEGQGSLLPATDNLTISEAGAKPKGIFSRFANFGNYIKKQDAKGTISDTNSEVDKTSVPSSPGEGSRRRKVKEKVKEFVEMFNQDSSFKSKMDAEVQSQKSEWHNKNTNKADSGASVITKRTGKYIPKYKSDKKFESSDTSEMVDVKIKHETMSTLVDKKKMPPITSAKLVKDILSPRAKKVESHTNESVVDLNIKSSVSPITDRKKETFEPVKLDSAQMKKSSSRNAGISTDMNLAFKDAPRPERKKEAYQNNPPVEGKKIHPSNSNKLDKKTDGFIKQMKEDSREESGTSVQKDTPSIKKDVSSPGTGSIPDLYQDANESLFDPIDAFEIKELTEELSNVSQMDEYQLALQESDAKIRLWSRGKEGNIRSLLTTLQNVLWPGSGWKPVALMDIIEANQVKRTYQRALLCLHPDKLQQKGAAEHQKYIAGKVFDILQESWNHFNTLTSL